MLTPLEPVGSSIFPHAFMLLVVRSETYKHCFRRNHPVKTCTAVVLVQVSLQSDCARVEAHTTALASETLSMSYTFAAISLMKGNRSRHIHKWVVDRDNKDLAGIFELGRVDISRNVVLRAGRRESSGHAWD
jgi:hypothetical protein